MHVAASQMAGVIPVRVFGLDATGKPFFQDAQARELTLEGGQLDGLEHCLKTGDVIGLQYGESKVRVRVMWACEFEQQKRIQVGIKLLVPKDCPWLSVLSEQQGQTESGERRRSPRFRVAVGVRIRETGTGVGMQTNSTDISLNGCYVQTQLPLPIGTQLDVELWLDQERLSSTAMVRTCDPGVGMGIEFVGLSPAELVQLQQGLRRALMDKISGLR